MLKIKRKYIILLLSIILILTVSYSLKFQIPESPDNLSEGIKKHFNRGRYEQYIIKDLQVIKSIDIDNTKIALILVDNKEVGQVVLKKGLNGRFKVNNAFYGSSSINDEVLTVNDSNFLILSGRNHPMVKYIEVSNYSDDKRIEVIEGDYFIQAIPIPQFIKSTMDIDLKYYDKNNSEITHDVMTWLYSIK